MEAGKGRSLWVQIQPSPRSEFQDSQGSVVRLCLKTINKVSGRVGGQQCFLSFDLTFSFIKVAPQLLSKAGTFFSFFSTVIWIRGLKSRAVLLSPSHNSRTSDVECHLGIWFEVHFIQVKFNKSTWIFVSGHKVVSKTLWSDIQCHGNPPREWVQPDVLTDVCFLCLELIFNLFRALDFCMLHGWFLWILISYQGNTIFQIDQLFCYCLQETILINYHYNES